MRLLLYYVAVFCLRDLEAKLLYYLLSKFHLSCFFILDLRVVVTYYQSTMQFIPIYYPNWAYEDLYLHHLCLSIIVDSIVCYYYHVQYAKDLALFYGSQLKLIGLSQCLQNDSHYCLIEPCLIIEQLINMHLKHRCSQSLSLLSSWQRYMDPVQFNFFFSIWSFTLC